MEVPEGLNYGLTSLEDGYFFSRQNGILLESFVFVDIWVCGILFCGF